jgi:putative transcriptional regulator
MRILANIARIAFAAALAVAANAFALGAIAQSAGEAPYFLVATPDLPDPIFNKSAILVFATAHDEIVTGLIFNKATSVPVSRLYPGATGLTGDSTSAFFGGPVFPEQPSLLIRASKRPLGSILLFDDVYICTDPESIASILKDPATRDPLRLIVGRAQWLPGQLKGEMGQDSWYKVPADSARIFSTPPDQIWDLLSKRGKLIEVDWRAP